MVTMKVILKLKVNYFNYHFNIFLLENNLAIYSFNIIFLHFLILEIHDQWLHSMGEYTEAYDGGPSGYIGLEAFEEADATDRRALHEQWQEEKYRNDVDGPAFLNAHVRGKIGGGTPSENIKHITQLTAREEDGEMEKANTFSGLTARKIILKTQPRHKHIRNYTTMSIFE
jgi:hypothetical protein